MHKLDRKITTKLTVFQPPTSAKMIIKAIRTNAVHMKKDTRWA